MSPDFALTADKRYDLHLVPCKVMTSVHYEVKVMTSVHDAMKRNYVGQSENIAGLIENILALKVYEYAYLALLLLRPGRGAEYCDQPVCLCVCLSVCLSICLSVRLSICISVCLSVCLFVSLSIYLSSSSFISLNTLHTQCSLSVCLCVCPSVSLCLSVCLSIYLSVCPSVCLSVCYCCYCDAVVTSVLV